MDGGVLPAVLVTHIREALVTPLLLACMRLLASVCPDVDGESTSLNESLSTTWLAALVWSFVGVYAVVSL